MNNTNSKIGNLLGSVGVVGGIVFAMKKDKKLGVTALYAVGFGLVGLLIGNSINNFYK